MNYRINIYNEDAPQRIGITKTGEGVNGIVVFGTHNQAKDALATVVREEIDDLKAALKAALKVRERDLPVDSELAAQGLAALGKVLDGLGESITREETAPAMDIIDAKPDDLLAIPPGLKA